MTESFHLQNGLCTVPDAAKILNVSKRRVRQLINEKRLPAEKMGRQWIMRREDVVAFAAQPRNVGRPPRADVQAADVEIPDRPTAN